MASAFLLRAFATAVVVATARRVPLPHAWVLWLLLAALAHGSATLLDFARCVLVSPIKFWPEPAHPHQTAAVLLSACVLAAHAARTPLLAVLAFGPPVVAAALSGEGPFVAATFAMASVAAEEYTRSGTLWAAFVAGARSAFE